jgi:hypothetical protein
MGKLKTKEALRTSAESGIGLQRTKEEAVGM